MPCSSSEQEKPTLYLPQRHCPSTQHGIYDVSQKDDCDTVLNTSVNKYAGGFLCSQADPFPASSRPPRSAEASMFRRWENESTRVFSQSCMMGTTAVVDSSLHGGCCTSDGILGGSNLN